MIAGLARRAITAVLLALSCVPSVVPSCSQAAELPRVFFTPAERAAITRDRLAGRPVASRTDERDATAAAAIAPSGETGEVPARAAPRAARVEGITVGRDARPVAWIGGERIVDGANWGEYRIRVERDGVRLVAGDGSVRRVRVGMELPP
jgi:hypothetical protein